MPEEREKAWSKSRGKGLTTPTGKLIRYRLAGRRLGMFELEKLEESDINRQVLWIFTARTAPRLPGPRRWRQKPSLAIVTVAVMDAGVGSSGKPVNLIAL